MILRISGISRLQRSQWKTEITGIFLRSPFRVVMLHLKYSKYDNMSSSIKHLWRTISTGWVIEYPSERNGPADFFDGKDRKPYGWNAEGAARTANRSESSSIKSSCGRSQGDRSDGKGWS
ncbi:hypothetical protein HYFRA_00007128 [Hymenoscyphus fraxineus]|uniref:Uncharacterized protein n=1 Tax=Hymenoscyphus fraxineus TaxID=746836 RepID=A0A9N9KYI3_9HELO|nr:hypothetical protein HYFRA_00007128 [Hymenoscyphus fraxineus]